jgi:hypothetical protein
MIRPLYMMIAATALVFTGCHSRKQILTEEKVQSAPDNLHSLETRLAPAGNRFTTNSVPLVFTVINKGNNTQRFCKWETPFEPKLGKYFEIVNEKGEEATFKGAMARRVMPPPAEAYMQVPAHKNLATTINLADNYTLTAGTYTIKYTGGGISGLNPANEVKITITAN